MIVIGSRGSQLALWQARHIAARLQSLGAASRIEIIKTSGDRIQDVPLAQVGGKGLFTKEIEEALLAGSIDLAVHSLKDVPTALPAGLTLAAIPEREEPRDALVGCTVADLRAGLRVGTSSLRRSAQLRALGRSIALEMLRGNVDTRLRKLDEGRYDAIVLAAAGLRRLGWQDRIGQLIPVEIMCPAVGQGALAIETRDDGGAAHTLVGKLDHAPSRAAVTAERALLETLGGGCQVPVGAFAVWGGPPGPRPVSRPAPGAHPHRPDQEVHSTGIHLIAVVASPDGATLLRGELAGPDPAQLGAALGRTLLDQGAREILQAAYSA